MKGKQPFEGQKNSKEPEGLQKHTKYESWSGKKFHKKQTNWKMPDLFE